MTLPSAVHSSPLTTPTPLKSLSGAVKGWNDSTWKTPWASRLRRNAAARMALVQHGPENT